VDSQKVIPKRRQSVSIVAGGFMVYQFVLQAAGQLLMNASMPVPQQNAIQVTQEHNFS
jgi:predicted component of type VI protein secretion system